uniref:Formyltetrahydrofolate deformylase n=1 Tax=Nocardioides panacis TaxID=2849501 RepID=A0A975Y290_9ACTN|nr:formyltetrahydrofolate deformylase [Nocardioides panacis]QWZ10311.1 formyltetrahydrofolate deformylase [Nocardioides panacis]
MTDQTYVLTLTCPDRAGIVHAVTGLLVEQHGNIVESQQFGDLAEDRFFMRVKFAVEGDVTVASLRAAFTPVAERWGMAWELWAATAPYRTLILVSKFSHCLNDLLFRWSSGSLQIDVAGVVSNHPDCETLVRSYGVPYHHVPVTPETKADAEAKMLSLVDTLDVDLVVLARYMQVLTDETCRALSGKAINIHHSFLPSFKGARPYHQAFDRGVKLVGATAHYVTGDLDEGPIIEQDVMRVDHGYDAAALAAAGRDVESQVLSRAVRWHAESRVLLNGHKTVVFR